MISKTGVHAIRALTELTALPDGQSLGAAQIADRIDAPPNYLSKLLRVLAREGLVESNRGPGGGFRLARDPRQIRLLDVVQPIEPVIRWNDCILRRSECPEGDPCAMHDQWNRLRGDYLAMLAGTTIADLDRAESRSP